MASIDVEVEGIDALGICAIEWTWDVPDWCHGLTLTGFPPADADTNVTLRIRITPLTGDPAVEEER